MIELTRLNKSTLYVNDELVELIESTPDTVMTFVSGRKLLVSEEINDILDRIREYRESVRRN